MLEFQLKTHKFRPNVSRIEVVRDGEVAAEIFVEGNGLKISSSLIRKVDIDNGESYCPPIPVVNINFRN